MPNLKEVRNRIVSVGSTQQITSAMKMVSAAKLRRAQDAITQMRPYANKLREILENLSAGLSGSEGVYSKERKSVNNVLLIAITSNRGLCGAFNANVIRRVNLLAKNEYANSKVTVLCIGKKAHDAFKKTNLTLLNNSIDRNLSELFDDLTFDNVADVARRVMDDFAKEDFDKVELIYNQFKNAAVQNTVVEPFLPVKPTETGNTEEKKKSINYFFEPSKEEIVEDLIPRSLKTQLYKALLDSHAAEHGARMTAMHKATDNAQELLKSLRLTYNKARQAAITNEILEIVSGAEALNG